ncbi:MAG TPA: polysaccharide biosynthesis protein, partial [Firmicutes bacterium]|nr:polysaccharide biosynthesis protein [Bacillota bacterium]
REIVGITKETGLPVRILPGLLALDSEKVTLDQIREVRIEDLLGRDPVKLQLGEIAGYLKGERVLITGAGGSIGSELCRQVARFEPEVLLLLGRGENSIYEINQELAERFPSLPKNPIIADVRDRAALELVFREYSPTVVFHAAAHKHVPLMESAPDEAVKNNVFGTKNVAELADKYQAKRFVLISTDKAVNPTSVMGATKRIAEMIIQQMAKKSKTKFCAVRFGNVLGSRGSVIPLFQHQIALGGPVTVTHPEMVRFFMTIPEAVSLVIQAGAMGEWGEIFILDMGEPVKIVDLARDLIRLSGLEPGKDIQIEFNGIRPGEKLYEEILT